MATLDFGVRVLSLNSLTQAFGKPTDVAGGFQFPDDAAEFDKKLVTQTILHEVGRKETEHIILILDPEPLRVDGHAYDYVMKCS
jgi:hypothetical protein